MKRQQLEAVRDTGWAVILLAWTTLLFRLGGQRAVARATRRAIRVTDADRGDVPSREDDIWRAFRAVGRATRLWRLRVTCLQISLTLHHVLQGRGLSAPVCLGAHIKDGRVVAHAWVRCGPFVLDSADVAADFKPLLAPRDTNRQRATT